MRTAALITKNPRRKQLKQRWKQLFLKLRQAIWVSGNSSKLLGGKFGLGLQACTQPSPTATQPTNKLQGKLVLTGSSTIAPLAAEIGKRFESEYPDVRVDVQTGGSSRGIADARTGVANIGMASRSLKEEEKDLQGFA